MVVHPANGQKRLTEPKTHFIYKVQKPPSILVEGANLLWGRDRKTIPSKKNPEVNDTPPSSSGDQGSGGVVEMGGERGEG